MDFESWFYEVDCAGAFASDEKIRQLIESAPDDELARGEVMWLEEVLRRRATAGAEEEAEKAFLALLSMPVDSEQFSPEEWDALAAAIMAYYEETRS